MAPAISARLSETFELAVPRHLTEVEQALIASYFTQTHQAHCEFNFPLGLFGLLDRLWDELTDTGAVWIFELADISPMSYGDYSALTVGFRGVVCYPLLVDLIQWYWRQKTGEAAASPRRDGLPVGVVLSKSSLTSDADIAIYFSDAIVDFGDELEIGLTLISAQTPDWESKLVGLEQSVPVALRSDYHICIHFALKWAQVGRYGQALDWLQPIFRRYGMLAIPAQTLAARCYKMLGNYTEAKQRLLEVVAVAPDCAYAYKELSLLMLKDQNWIEFKQFAMQSVQHGTQDLPWNLLLSIALLHLQEGRREDAEVLLAHLDAQAMIWPDGFEIGFRDRVRSALTLTTL
jgi:hypothetical protein